ncbi:ENR1 protein, partial [Cisticola juncidis]|nr:ENR1 protein [Cisticola juncidis]
HEGYNLYQCVGEGKNPFWEIYEISKYWEGPISTDSTFWTAPDYLFWICGDQAYTHLPGNWAGSCTLGVIKPAFFLLPQDFENKLGVPL